MPTKRLLYTLGEVKKIIADLNNTDHKCVQTYDCQAIILTDHLDCDDCINDNSYLFQVDVEQ